MKMYYNKHILLDQHRIMMSKFSPNQYFKENSQALGNSISIPQDLSIINISVDREGTINASERRQRIQSSNIMHRRKLHTSHGTGNFVNRVGFSANYKRRKLRSHLRKNLQRNNQSKNDINKVNLEKISEIIKDKNLRNQNEEEINQALTFDAFPEVVELVESFEMFSKNISDSGVPHEDKENDTNNKNNQRIKSCHKIKSKFDRVSTVVKYRSALTIQKMYRGHLARRVHWEALCERLTKLRSHRLLTKRIQNMEETINKLAYESKSTSEAVKTISKAWRAHRLNTVIDNRIEIKKKRKLSIEKNQTEVAKSKKSKKGHKKVGHTPHSKQDKRPSFVNLNTMSSPNSKFTKQK